MVSLRQTLLHINPYFDTAAGRPAFAPLMNPPFGQAVMGYHLHVWGIVLFMTVIFAAGVALLFRRQFEPSIAKEPAGGPAWVARLARNAGGLLFAVAALETLTTFLECGLGECPNDGGWTWWIARFL